MITAAQIILAHLLMLDGSAPFISERRWILAEDVSHANRESGIPI
jgi:hypothetical protein